MTALDEPAWIQRSMHAHIAPDGTNHWYLQRYKKARQGCTSLSGGVISGVASSSVVVLPLHFTFIAPPSFFTPSDFSMFLADLFMEVFMDRRLDMLRPNLDCWVPAEGWDSGCVGIEVWDWGWAPKSVSKGLSSARWLCL